LTSGVDGKAIMKGERLYSNYHHQFFEAKGVYVDCDGDVYIYFDGGNVKLTSIAREDAVKHTEVNDAYDGMEVA
jgi:hypothetical protein